MTVNKYLQSNPTVLVILALYILIMSIGIHISFYRDPLSGYFMKVLTLGNVIFMALTLGILLFWWHSWKPLEMEAAGPGAVEPENLDLSEVFFNPEGFEPWFSRNIKRIRGNYANFERITQLISFINYSVHLPRQIKVGLNLAHEIFPDTMIGIFLWKDGQFSYSTGTRLGMKGVLEDLPENDAKSLGFHDSVFSTIDVEKLRQLGGVCFALPIVHNSSVIQSGITTMPLILWNKILGVIVYFSTKDQGFSDDEKVLATLLNRHVAVFIENHYLYQEKVQQERIRKEIEIAKLIQDETFPKGMAAVSGFDLFGICNSCNEISGDYYDFVPLQNDGLIVTIADVSGKGVPASLFLSKIQTLVRAFSEHFESPAKFLTFLSRQMNREQMGSLFATMFIGILRPNSPNIICSSAGHCKPLVIRASAGFVEEISFEVGVPLGLFEPTGDEYVDQTIELMPGDGIILYSDGLTDAVNPARERFGVDRIKTTLERAADLDAKGMVRYLLEEMTKFRNMAPLEDDVTLVNIKSEKKIS